MPQSSLDAPAPPGACGALRDADLWCPALLALSLKGCGALRRVALNCPALQQLDATFCSELEDMGGCCYA